MNRSRIEEERDDLQLRLSALVDDADDAVISVDADGVINGWNPAAQQMFGWSPDEALGRSIEIVSPPERRHLAAIRMAALRHGDRVLSYETVRIDRTGARRLVRVHLVALRQQDRFLGAVGTVRDLSDAEVHGRRLSRLLKAMPLQVVTFDEHAVVTFSAGGVRRDLEPRAEELLPGMSLLSWEGAAGPLRDAVRAALAGRSTDTRVLLEDRRCQVHVAPLPDPEAEQLSGHVAALGGFLVALDITEQQDLNDRLDLILASSSICLATLDPDGRVTYAAGAGFRSMGVDPGAVVGSNAVDLVARRPPLAAAIKACLAGNDGEAFAEFAERLWEVHCRSLPGTDSSNRGGLVIAQDRTPTASDPEVAQPVASTMTAVLDRDELTGLLSRRALHRRLAEPIGATTHRCVALVDLDGFELVQDAYGALAADDVLRDLGSRIAAVAPEDVSLGRWHADQFVLVLDGPDAATALEALSERVLDSIRTPLQYGALSLHLACSVGIADSRTADARDLLTPATVALKAAKRDGGDRCAWYRASMTRHNRPRLALASDLRRLVTARDFTPFELYYQPIVELGSQRVTAAEAVLRWHHPTHGLVTPDQFLDFAERTGLIEPLGNWVIDQGCRAAAGLQKVAGGRQTVSVNLSARELAQPDLLAHVRAALDAHSCSPSSIVLEVSERSVTADLQKAAATLDTLKELGVRIALDDFGTGYSSLLYLKHLPIDILKIDRSFVSGLGTNPDDSAIVAATVSLANTLEVQCVAEGIETVDQLMLLRKLECRYGQGYVFSRPLPLSGLQEWLEEHTDARKNRRRPRQQERPDMVATILRMHAEGASLHTIAAALNSQGKRTVKGVRWSPQAVARLIATTEYPKLSLPFGRER